MALWMLPLGEKFDIAVFAGPTYFKLSQGTIGEVTTSEVGPPYTSVKLNVPAVVTTDASKWGVNVGADATYKFMRNFGVGGFVRWAGTKVDITPANGTAISVNVGGVQYGAGLRVRF